MMNFSDLTDVELEEAKNVLNEEINKRYKEGKEKHKEELIKLLNRINELQDKYDFEISCEDDYDSSWISSAVNFELRE